MQKYKAIKVEHQWQIIEGDTLIAIYGCDNSTIPTFDVPEEWEEDGLHDYNKECNLNKELCKMSWLIGYNAAKEKYKWTDEDMEKMFELGNLNRGIHFKYLLNSIKQPKEYEVDIEFVNNKVIIKSWKEIN